MNRKVDKYIEWVADELAKDTIIHDSYYSCIDPPFLRHLFENIDVLFTPLSLSIFNDIDPTKTHTLVPKSYTEYLADTYGVNDNEMFVSIWNKYKVKINKMMEEYNLSPPVA